MTDDKPPTISLLKLQDATLAAITAIRDEIQHLLDVNERRDEFAQTIASLVYYMSGRSQAVTMLTSWSMPWDAEIVLRSFYEASAKIVFLALSPADHREELVEEFWVELDSIHAIRRARKAEFVQPKSESGNISDEVFGALRDPNLQDLAPRHNKARRKEIEQRWSFAEIVEALAEMDVPQGRLEHIRSLLHMYGMASHLIHADKSALDLMTDRLHRPEPERSIVAAAQAGRIFSDLVYLWFFCADAIRRAFGLSFKNPSGIAGALDLVDRHGRPFADMFTESQKDFYQRLHHKADANGDTNQRE